MLSGHRMLAADPFGPVHIRLWVFVNLSSSLSEHFLWFVMVHCPAEGGCCCQGVPFPLGLGMLDLQYCYSAVKPGLSVKKYNVVEQNGKCFSASSIVPDWSM